MDGDSMGDWGRFGHFKNERVEFFNFFYQFYFHALFLNNRMYCRYCIKTWHTRASTLSWRYTRFCTESFVSVKYNFLHWRLNSLPSDRFFEAEFVKILKNTLALEKPSTTGQINKFKKKNERTRCGAGQAGGSYGDCSNPVSYTHLTLPTRRTV